MSRSFASKLSAIAFALFALGAAPVLAQQNAAPPITPSHQAIATEVLVASGMNVMFQNALPNAISGIRQNVSRQRPELVRDIEASLAEIEKQIPEIASDGVAVASRFLAVRMSEEELKEVQKFLSSDVGKKYVAVLPAFMDDVVPFLEQWGQAAGQAINQAFRVEMQKRGHNL